MINQTLFYLGSFFLFFWGVAHLIPTKFVVQGFGNISPDNRRIITMEWIVEGVFLIFLIAFSLGIGIAKIIRKIKKVGH